MQSGWSGILAHATARVPRSPPGALVDSGAMERTQRLGGVVALLILGVVLVSLYRAFESAISQPIALFLGIALGGAMTVLMLRVALVPESRPSGWVRGVTGRNGRYAFLLLLFAWTAGMVAIKFLPRQNEGGLALVGLLVGFFLFMGFIWSVISE